MNGIILFPNGHSGEYYRVGPFCVGGAEPQCYMAGTFPDGIGDTSPFIELVQKAKLQRIVLL